MTARKAAAPNHRVNGDGARNIDRSGGLIDFNANENNRQVQGFPAPFVPPDVDLRSFAFLPLDIVRLFGSEFHAQSNDAEWRAGVTLWLKSFHQVPAASLPADDVTLTRLAELGRDTKQWGRIRRGALRGWVACNDGRLYHRTVAEKALEGWLGRLQQKKASAAGNAKRYSTPFDPAPFDKEVEQCRGCLDALRPASRTTPGALPTGGQEGSQRDADRSPGRLPKRSQVKGKGKGREVSKPSHRAELSQDRAIRAQGHGSAQAWDDDAPFGDEVPR